MNEQREEVAAGGGSSTSGSQGNRRAEFIQNEDGTWFACFPDKPGCMTEGDTLVHAAEMLLDAERGWDAAEAEEGDSPTSSPSSHDEVTR